MFGTAQSPWFQLFAFVVIAALTTLTLWRAYHVHRRWDIGTLWPAFGAVILLWAGLFAFYFGATADEADPIPLQPEGMTELNNQAPVALTPSEIEADSKETTSRVFQETSKTVEDHQDESDKFVDRALERAQRQR